MDTIPSECKVLGQWNDGATGSGQNTETLQPLLTLLTHYKFKFCAHSINETLLCLNKLGFHKESDPIMYMVSLYNSHQYDKQTVKPTVCM